MDFMNGHEDKQFDKLMEEDAVCLTNKHKFFPELAWKTVMDKLDKKTDIESCSNASPFFGDLLSEKRESEVLLPTVFGVLAKRYSNWTNKDESYKEPNVESITWSRPAESGLPHKMTGLLKCRLVCKKWNHAIEEIHRNEDASHFRMGSDKRKKTIRVGRKWGTDAFSGESDVEKFLGHFQATHYDALQQVSKKCPFLGRAVEVNFCRMSLETTQAYSIRLVEMFEKFGDQVSYLKLSWWCEPYEDDHIYIYQKLKQVVVLMPTLKVLRIKYYNFFDWPTIAQVQALEEEMQRNPFPELTNLEMISVYRIPGVLCNHLVNQNRQINRLEIDSIDCNGNCSIFVDKLPNLSYLSMVEVDFLEIFEAFETYPAILNLKKFHFHCTDQFPFVRWSRIFNAIGSKINSEICTDLHLRMHNPTTDLETMSVLEDSLECRLTLANIQRCQLESYDEFFLDFLLLSKNTLREMKIEYMVEHYIRVYEREQEELRDKQVIKFLGCEENMEESNIAKELPRLRKLEVYLHDIRRQYSIDPNGVIKGKKVDSW